MKLGIRRRIVLSLVLLALLVASAALIAVLTHQRLHDAIDRVGAAERQGRAALELSLAVRDMYAHQAHTIILGDRSHLAHYAASHKQVIVLVDVMAGLVEGHDDRNAVAEIARQVAALEDNFRGAIVPLIPGPAAALVGPHDRALALVDRITRTIDGMTFRIRQRAVAARHHADASHEAEIGFHLALVLIAAAFAAGVAVYLTRAIARPLGELQRGAERLATGDLATRIAVPADRDLGALAGAFNTMAAELDRHQRERLASERLASIGRVAAGIAHEINNPLAVIIGHARLLRKSPDARLADDASRIAHEAERCSAIVQGLLDLARPTRLSYGEVELEELVADVAAALGTASRPCRVAVEGAANVPADGRKLRQIVMNLLDNARAAAPAEPITVAIARRADEVVMRISDRGRGPDPALALFEPFQTDKPEGTGLGLAVSRALARAHGGELALTASGRHGGVTTFELRLPARAAHAAEAS